MTRAALAILVLLSVFSQTAAGRVPVELVSSDDGGVVLRYVPGAFATRPIVIDGATYTLVTVDGADLTGEPGAPELPVVRATIAVPDCDRVDIRVSSTGTTTERGIRIAPSPSIDPVADGEVSRFLYIEGDPYRDEGPWPARAASMAGPKWTTTQRTVTIELYPCQFVPSESELLRHGSIEVQLSFQGVRAHDAPLGELPRRERLIESLVLNYESAKEWRRGRVPRRAGPRDDYFSASGNWVKLSLQDRGVYAVDYSDLDGAGVDAGAIDPETFRVFFGGGLSVPKNVTEPRPEWMTECDIHVEGEGDGSFDLDDRVIFCAVGIDDWVDELEIENSIEPYHENMFTNDTVYWLTWENEGTSSGFTEPPKRMLEDDLQDSPNPLVVESYRARQHFERNIYDFLGRSDNWFWFEMRRTGQSETRYFHEQLDHVRVDSTGLLRARLDGNSSNSSVFPDHHVLFYLNDTEAYVGEWDGYSRLIFESDGLPMREGYNSFQITVPREGEEFEEDYVLIDWFDLEYWRELWVGDGQLRFGSSGKTGVVEYSLTGSGTSDVDVFKVIDKYSVRTVPGVGPAAERVVFQDDVADTASYVAVGTGGYRTPAVELDTFGDLRTPAGADYLMIVYDGFYDEALRLKAYRQSATGGGFSAQLVRTSDVYDEFSWGLTDPTAIRDFLKYVWDNTDPPPTHTILIGDASYDYRQYQSSSIPTYLPPVYTGSSYWPADQWFVGFESVTNYDPAMALGRLTARSTSELATIIDKIERYEGETMFGTWKNRALIVGDDEFKGDNDPTQPEYYHTTQAEQIATDVLPWALDRVKVYLMEYDYDAAGNKSGARRDIIDAWNDGALLMNYTGHGNELLMAHENVFLLDDVPRLHNIDALPLFFAASCRLNRFDMPTGDSLGEALLKSPIGGTVVSIGSTRDSGAGQNSVLNRAFLRQMFGNQQDEPATALDVGQAFQAGFIETSGSSSTWTNNTRFAVIGDPAVQLVSPRGSADADTDGLEPMRRHDTVTIEGDNTGETAGESGVMLVRVTDSADTSGYDQTDPQWPPHHVDYRLPGDTVFDGPTSATNGAFLSQFVVSTFSEEGPYARIRGYFYGDDIDGSFSVEDVALSDSIDVADNAGPRIEIGFEGGATSILPGAPYTITIDDDHGVNLVDRDRENGIVLRIDAGSDTTSLTDEFLYDLGSYRQGSIDGELPSLSLGAHTLSVAATDNVGNREIGELWIEIVSSQDFQIRSVANHPNPFPDGGSRGTTILFQLPTAANVRIDIFTVGGRLIRSLRDIPAAAGASQVYWDGLDAQGDELSNGVYLYRIQAVSEEYRGDRAEAIGRAVVMR